MAYYSNLILPSKKEKRCSFIMRSFLISVFVFDTLFCQCMLHAGDVKLLKETKFGYRVDGNTFQTFFGLPWLNCLENCKKIRKCGSVNYFRRSGFCELNDAHEITNPSALQTQPGVLFSSKLNWDYEEPEHCKVCLDTEICTSDIQDTCKIAGCPLPNQLSTGCTSTLGNMATVGARRMCICKNGMRHVITCEADGRWSAMDITCLCGTPELNRASYNIIEYNSTLLVASIYCGPGYVKLGVDNIYCDSISKEWSGLDRVECVKVKDESWTLIYGKLQGISGNIYNLWTGEETSNEEFRNDEVLEQWSKKNNKNRRVKVEVTDFSDKAVVSLLFDAKHTNIMNWFSNDNLLQSPWTDLQNGISVDIFDISGVVAYSPENERIALRWAILDYDIDGDNNKIINCTHNHIWFAIMHAKFYPCENLFETSGIKSGHVIVFSNSTTGTPWNAGRLGHAKKMLIYERS